MCAKRKIRADFRKKHQERARRKDLTREIHRDENALDRIVKSERVSGKGDLTRKRTIVGHEADEEHGGFAVVPAVDPPSAVVPAVVTSLPESSSEPQPAATSVAARTRPAIDLALRWLVLMFIAAPVVVVFDRV